MKKIYLWSLFLISISVLIFSCRKDYKNFFNQKDDIVSSDLEAAKIFHAKGAYLNKTTYAELMAQGSKSVLSTEKIAKKVFFIKLSPLWKDAFEVKAYDGSDLIVVPTPENRLSDKTFEIRRFFIFTKKGGSIVDGKIVEFLGAQYALKDKMNDIIANYKNSSVVDLTGAIFEYDLNYFFLNGEKIEQGKRTGQFSKFNKLSKARTQSNLKTNGFEGFESGPMDPNVCYELYWSTYINGVMVSAVFTGYSNGCYGTTTGGGGSVSGYDSASAYQSGGGDYAGNQGPPPQLTPIVNVAPNTRPCVDSLLSKIKNSAAMTGTLIDMLNVRNQNTTNAQNAVVYLSSLSNFSMTISETTISDKFITDPATGNIISRTETHGSTDPITSNITINTLTLNKGTDLAAAATMIHELMHAYLVYGAQHLTGQEKMAFEDVNRYMFDAENSNPIPPGVALSQAQHYQMAETYLDSMSGLLESVAGKLGITQSPDNSISLNQYCKDIFWGNLQQTSGLTPPNPTRATTNANKEYNNSTGSSNKKGC